MKQAVLSIGLLLCALGAQAAPAINVGVVYDYLEQDRSSYLKRVSNTGTSTAFIRVDVLEIVYNADGTHREVPVASLTDSDGNTTRRDGLMASPARLIVPANGRQGTRLLYMGPRDKERYFRVRFIPVVPEKDDNFAITDEERADYKDSLAAGINVMAGYGTVFFVRPKDTRFDTQINQTGNQYQRVTTATAWWYWMSFVTVRLPQKATACRPPSITSCRGASWCSRKKPTAPTAFN